MSSVVVRHRRVLALWAAIATLFALVVAIAARPAEAAYPGANGWIVFEKNFDLYVIAPSGGTPINLTPTGATNYADPSFSPDGTQIAFSSNQGSGGGVNIANIYVADFDSDAPSLGTPTKVTSGDRDGEPSWSPDGTMLVFERKITFNISTGKATAADPAGTTLTDGTTGTFQTDGVEAGMDVTNTTADWEGVVAGAPGSETVLSVTPDIPNSPWAVGDDYVVSVDNTLVYRVTIAGGAEVRLSSDTAPLGYDDKNPVWSVGNRIAFETTRGGNADIYESNINGADLVNLTPDPIDTNANRPAWSPDGTLVAFHTNEPNTAHANIWTVPQGDGTGNNFDQITGASNTGTDSDTRVAWSPDGTQMVFNSAPTGVAGRGLSVINADGSGSPTVLTTPAASVFDDEPNWQPQLVGVTDAYSVDEGGTLNVPVSGTPFSGVLDNDSLFTSAIGTATASQVVGPLNGALTLNTDGSFTYTHDGSETTSDSFSYRPVQNGVNGTVATVNITINPQNDAPTAKDDGPFNVETIGGTLNVAAPGVLENDTDPDDSGLTAIKVTDPANGTVTLNADGSFTYKHDGSDTDSDSFTYKANDGTTDSNVATVSLTIGKGPLHTTALVDPTQGEWHLYDDAGVQTTSFFYGNPGDFPILGDWDCDGIETPGMYRQSDGFVYLRNSNTQGIADIRFFFGNPGDVPIAGDFNGDGCGTVSIYRPSNQTFYIINELGKDEGGLGAAEFSYVFGNPGDKPFVGDFDGDGVETVGLHRESTGFVYFRNSHTQGIADNEFFFGDPGDRFIAGDWTGDRMFTPALFRPSNTTMYFRYTNTQGNADAQFVPAPVGSAWLPVSGVTSK